MSFSTPRFGRVITAMATPFADDGSLDLGASQELARRLVSQGSDALVVAGTTGESPVLTDTERLDLFRAVAEAVEVPMIAGSTTNDTAHSVDLSGRVSELGASAVLAVTPYYNRPSQEGLRAHFTAIAAATELPVLLYDVPHRTGRHIEADTVLRLAESVENVVGLKDAGGDVAATAALAARAPAGFEIYSGDDALALAQLAAGAVGVISVASHWIGNELKACLEAFVAGEVTRATALNAELVSSYRFESTERWPSPLPTKAVLRAMGLRVGQCRLPMGPADAELDAAAASLLESLGRARG